MQVSDLYYKKYLKYKNKYLNLQSQIGGLPPFNLVLPKYHDPPPVLPLTITYINKNFSDSEFLELVSSLKNITNVQNLKLNIIGITEARVKQLVEFLVNCSQLRTLNLSNNPLNNNGATTIANILNKLSMLTTLELSRCNIGNGGGKAIAYALSNNQSSLTTLNIEWNLIGDPTFIAFAEALKSNSILINLNISYSNQPRSTNAYEELANALKINTTLQILNIKGIYLEKDIQLFRGNTRVIM